MAKKSNGVRKGTRKFLRQKGIRSHLREFRAVGLGQSVTVKIDPGVHRGMPSRIFQGKTGVVINFGKTVATIRLKFRKIQKLLSVNKAHLI